MEPLKIASETKIGDGEVTVRVEEEVVGLDLCGMSNGGISGGYAGEERKEKREEEKGRRTSR